MLRTEHSLEYLFYEMISLFVSFFLARVIICGRNMLLKVYVLVVAIAAGPSWSVHASARKLTQSMRGPDREHKLDLSGARLQAADERRLQSEGDLGSATLGNHGSRCFENQQIPKSSKFGGGMYLGDFDGDSKTDILGISLFSFSLIFNSPAPTFQPVSSERFGVTFTVDLDGEYASNDWSSGNKQVYDLDGDGDLDFAVTGYRQGIDPARYVAVWCANDGVSANGSVFTEKQVIDVEHHSDDMIVVDINQDGNVDLVTSTHGPCGVGCYSLYMLQGDGEGHFESPVESGTGCDGDKPI